MFGKRERMSGSAGLFFLLFFAALWVAFWKLVAGGLWLAMGGLTWKMGRERFLRSLKMAAVLLWSASAFSLMSLWFLWQIELRGRALALA